MDIAQIKELMSLLEESKLSKLVAKQGDFELHLEKETAHLPRSRVVSIEEAAPTEVKRSDSPGHYVSSPMVGTFYSSPAPDQPPFVKVGDKVLENTVVCIVEAMKVMNEVKAGVSGTIAEVITDSGQPVEFGSRLFRIT